MEGKSFATAAAESAPGASWEEIPVSVTGAQSVITDDRWRLTLFPATGEGQMFDLGEDPDEQNDLYNELPYAAKQNELFCRLSAVTTRPSRIAYYRNMPVHEGRKLLFDRETSDGSLPFMMAYGPPVQDLPFAPALLHGDHS